MKAVFRFLITGSLLPSVLFAQKKPNILCIVCEDISPMLGCYGDPIAVSPHLDRFSQESVRYTHMFTTVGVSSPSRYALITGRYPSSDGANYMRSNFFNKKFESIPADPATKCVSELMRQNGYYCTNNAKTDYQFQAPKSAWDEQGAKAHWKNAPEDKPFFSIFNINLTHESFIWKSAQDSLWVQPEDVQVPQYYPDNPIVRRDIAICYSNIARMDQKFAQLLAQLDASDRVDNTIVLFYSDNGGPLPRGKREILDSGTRVPFMVRYPAEMQEVGVCRDLQMFVDIPASILSIAGIDIPSWMHGQPFLGEGISSHKRQYVFGATDRFDEQVEKRASIRDNRYLYVYNYMPKQSNYKPNAYRRNIPMMLELERLFAAGQLNQDQSLWFQTPAPQEELYDCVNDPDQLHNLAYDPKHSQVLKRMKKALTREWIKPYNQKWVENSEKDFIREMWPDGQKPVMKSASSSIEDRTLTLSATHPHASISYRLKGKKRWNLYDAPISFKDPTSVEVIVESIGHTSSPIQTIQIK